jgi:hypothetical protein
MMAWRVKACQIRLNNAFDVENQTDHGVTRGEKASAGPGKAQNAHEEALCGKR